MTKKSTKSAQEPHLGDLVKKTVTYSDLMYIEGIARMKGYKEDGDIVESEIGHVCRSFLKQREQGKDAIAEFNQRRTNINIRYCLKDKDTSLKKDEHGNLKYSEEGQQEKNNAIRELLDDTAEIMVPAFLLPYI